MKVQLQTELYTVLFLVLHAVTAQNLLKVYMQKTILFLPSFFSFIQFSVSQRKCQEKKRAVGQNAEALFVKIQLV